MKSLKGPIALSFLMALALASPNLALAGKGSGGGNGDREFAFQEIADANPGLPLSGVLFKAFEDASGRIPVIRTRTGLVKGEKMEFGWFLPTRDKRFSYIAEFIYYAQLTREDPGGRTEDIDMFRIQRSIDVERRGPLLARRPAARFQLCIKGFDGRECFYQRESATGLVFGDENASSPYQSNVYEFRQFNEDIVIYARPKTKENTCVTIGSIVDGPLHAPAKYCEIGFFWKPKKSSKKH